MDDSLATEILKQLCYRREQILIAFGLLATLWVTSVVGLVVLPSGTGAYAVTVLNLVTLSVFLLMTGALLTVCFRSDLRFG